MEAVATPAVKKTKPLKFGFTVGSHLYYGCKQTMAVRTLKLTSHGTSYGLYTSVKCKLRDVKTKESFTLYIYPRAKGYPYRNSLHDTKKGAAKTLISNLKDELKLNQKSIKKKEASVAKLQRKIKAARKLL